MVDILAVLAGGGGGGRVQFLKMLLFLCFLLFVYYPNFFRCPIVPSFFSLLCQISSPYQIR
jgi:hypothetical protein